MRLSICIAAVFVAVVIFTVQATNATTVSVLLSDLNTRLGDDSTNSRFTNTEKRRALTEASGIVARIVGLIEAETSMVCAPLKREYTLASNCWGVDAVYFINENDYRALWYRTPDQLGKKLMFADSLDLSAPSTVVQWTYHRGIVRIWPALASYSNDTLRMFYYKEPSSLDSNSQSSDLPSWTDELVVEYADHVLNARDLTIGEEASYWGYFVNKVNLVAYTYARKRMPIQQSGAQQ